jgi:outer membrane receptor protein involved in Fe transport
MFTMLVRRSLQAVLMGSLVVTGATAQQSGRIEGIVRGDDSNGFASAHVRLRRIDNIVGDVVSDSSGHFSFDNVAPGRYSLLFSAEDQMESGIEPDIEVLPGQTSSVSKDMLWHTGSLARVTVYAASRANEPIVNAPATVAIIEEPEIKLEGISGQIPDLLSQVPGAELTQNGLFDYNFNVRGFNTPLNRRIQTSIDGRTPEIPLLGYQEWSSISLLTDDLETVELVSGPSSAVYGANAFNGVIDIRTKMARDSLGGTVRFTFGQLSTARVESRTAFRLGRGWYLKLAGGYHGSNDFARSRNVTVEYPGLPHEVIPIPEKRVNLGMGTATAEKYFNSGRYLLVEAGGASLAGVVFLTPTGRLQSDNIRSWTRFKARIPDWTFSFSTNTRHAPTTPAFGSGAPITEEDRSLLASVQTDLRWGSRTTFVGGVGYGTEYVNTAGANGIQTLLTSVEQDHHGDIFGEVRYALTDSLTLSGALDIAASTLHNVQLSPRAALVYKIDANQSLRFSYNHAFQVANFVELFIDIHAGPPLNLSAVEAKLAPLTGGVPLGLSAVPVLATGNPSLDVEKITSYEAGYRRAWGVRGWITLDYYRNRMNKFITDILPGVNPAYKPYQAPAALQGPVRAIVSAAIDSISPGFTNLANGDPAIVLSLANSDRVDSQGVELGVTRNFLTYWRAGANYSWFDFNVQRQPPGIEIHPNAPTHKAGGSMGFRRSRFDMDVRYRWVNGFPFANGLFVGPVHSYNVVDLAARYQINSHWELGAHVANLLNDEHYEIFGGDILQRRALGPIAWSWK